MPSVLRKSCTWIKCWHSREAQGELSCRKTQPWLYFCSAQDRRLCSGERWIHMTALCAESVQVQQLPAFILAEQPGWHFPTENTTDSSLTVLEQQITPPWVTQTPPSIQVQTDLEQPLPRHRLAQTCWLHLTQFHWKLAWQLCKYTPASWSGQR